MKLGDVIKFHKRARVQAISLGFYEMCDDIAQSVICKLLGGHHNHSTIKQVVIDCIRDEYGRAGSGKRFYNQAEKRTIRDSDWFYNPTAQIEARMDWRRVWLSLGEKEQSLIQRTIFRSRGTI